MAFSCTSSTLLLFITSMWCVTYGRKTRLVIGGLAGINIQTAGWSSSGVIPAIELALERVNKFSDILKEYYLVVDWRDSQVTCLNSCRCPFPKGLFVPYTPFFYLVISFVS